MDAAKADVRQFWEATPCGTGDTRDLAEQEQHRELERMRDAREPFIPEYARFAETAGQRVLEVGVGAGTDHLRFARAGALLSGVDLTEAAIALTSRRLALEGLRSDLRVDWSGNYDVGDDADASLTTVLGNVYFDWANDSIFTPYIEIAELESTRRPSRSSPGS